LPPEVARAVGLDPYPKFKDSGVPWLGKIPEHWRVTRLKFLSPTVTVGIVVEPSKYYVDSGIPCLRSLNVRPLQLIAENLVYISPESNELLAKSKLQLGDLVTVRSGQTGATAVINAQFDGANCIDLIIVRRPVKASGRFLAYFLNSLLAAAQYEMGTAGAIQGHFNVSEAANIRINCPPTTEQVCIADYLDHQTNKIDLLIANVQAAIERLTEYRSALITAAVTGKIDVRNYKGD
jgi:type I restriction enzyme S subunit